jgi:hypothetical protein
VDRVGGDVDVAVLHGHGEDDQVVDVLHVIADLAFGELVGSAAENQIAGCADGDLVRDVAGELELAVGPANFDLDLVSKSAKKR